MSSQRPCRPLGRREVAGLVTSPDAVRIRRATARDAAVLARLRYEFRSAADRPREAKQLFLARCGRWMRERLRRRASWRAWIAVAAGGNACGMVWLEVVEKVPNPAAERELHGYVTSLYVASEQRGRRVGTALLETALRECDTRGVDAVILWATERSRRLYARHGFATRRDLLERRPGAAT